MPKPTRPPTVEESLAGIAATLDKILTRLDDPNPGWTMLNRARSEHSYTGGGWNQLQNWLHEKPPTDDGLAEMYRRMKRDFPIEPIPWARRECGNEAIRDRAFRLCIRKEGHKGWHRDYRGYTWGDTDA